MDDERRSVGADARHAPAPPGPASWRRAWPAGALLVACLLTSLLLGTPVPDPRLTSDVRSDQGELSWEAVILDAIGRDARFGVDVVYTFGPLADLYIDQYHPAVWPRARLAKWACLLLLGGGAWVLTMVSPGPRWRRGLACAALLLPATQMNNVILPDGLFFVVAVLSQLVCVARPKVATYAISALACAWLCLAKFSYLPLYGVAVLLPLLLEVRLRRAILLAALAMTLLPLLWIASGQRTADLLPFMKASGELAAGYGPAMTRAYLGRAQVVFALPLLATAVALGTFATFATIARQRLATLVILGIAAYLVFKAGFTRHDLHVGIPFVWLASIGAAVVLLSRAPRRLLVAYAALFAAFAVDVERTVGAPYGISASSTRRQVDRIVAAFVTPAAAMARVEAQYAEQVAQVRGLPLAALVRKWQPADVDALDQIPALVATGKRPVMRPVFQSAAAYTATLAERNRRYYASLPAGATVIIESWTYDDRHPGLQQSGAWDLLVRDFEVVEQQPPFVVLRKTEPRTLTCDVDVRRGHLGEFLDLPAPPQGAIVIAAPTLRSTLLGRARQVLFRDVRTAIDSREGATVDEDRYVAAMGEQGFLLQPSVRDAADLPQVWDARASRPPTHVRIKTLEPFEGYAPEFEWRIRTCRRSTSTATASNWSTRP